MPLHSLGAYPLVYGLKIFLWDILRALSSIRFPQAPYR